MYVRAAYVAKKNYYSSTGSSNLFSKRMRVQFQATAGGGTPRCFPQIVHAFALFG